MCNTEKHEKKGLVLLKDILYCDSLKDKQVVIS